MAVFRKSVNLPAGNNASNASNIGNFPAGAPAGKITLNGSYVELDNTVNFIKRGYSSSVSITSAANISGTLFTIYGVNNGVYTTEVLAGANVNTVDSIGMYEKIISITTSGNIANGFTIGSNRNVAVLVEFLDNNFTNLKPEFSCSYTSPVGYVAAINTMGIIGINSPSNVMLYRGYGSPLVSITTAVCAGRPANFELISVPATTVALLNAGINYTSSNTAGNTMCSKILFIATNAVILSITNFTCIWTN
jgi:hypothetical protein